MRRDPSMTGSEYRRWHNQTMWDRPQAPVVYTQPEAEEESPSYLHDWENEGGYCAQE